MNLIEMAFKTESQIAHTKGKKDFKFGLCVSEDEDSGCNIVDVDYDEP